MSAVHEAAVKTIQNLIVSWKIMDQEDDDERCSPKTLIDRILTNTEPSREMTADQIVAEVVKRVGS